MFIGKYIKIYKIDQSTGENYVALEVFDYL